MGYVNNLAELIDGEVAALEPAYPTRGADMLLVRGYDRLHRLRRGRKQRSFLNMKYSDVAAQIANEMGLMPRCDATQEKHDYIFQTNQTNIDFLKGLARRINYELVVKNKELHFRKPRTDRSTSFTLEWGKSLKSFAPRMSTSGQVSEVVVRGWDPKGKKEIVGRAKKGDVKKDLKGSSTGPVTAERAFGQVETSVCSYPIFDRAEADALARSELNKRALNFLVGEGTCIGETDIRSGIVLELKGLGKRFSGNYYVASTTHTYVNGQGYSTSFTVQRSSW
jgi:phage protein D